MLPQANELSSQAVPGALLVAQGRTPFISYELAGVALQDPSQGLMVKLWTLEWDKHNGNFNLSAPGVATTVLENRSDVTEVTISFDRNMNYVLAWVESGQAKVKFYDSTIPGFTVWETELGDAVSPKLTHDDRRDNESAVDDVLLSYIRDGNLCYRQQRDRYGVEYLLASGLGSSARIAEFGMTRQLRVQWRISDANQISGATVRSRPTLADIILDLCTRVGIGEQQIDVDDLWDIEVGGYLVASEQTPADIITQLQAIYFFDLAEFDGKLHFLMRGRDVETTLTMDDFVERDNDDAVTITTMQEVELLRKLTFNFNDLTNGLGTNNAVAERRAATVNAQAEQSTEAPVSMTPTEALQTAQISLNVQWAERSTYEFTLSERHAFLTAGDVVNLVDVRGDEHRIRLCTCTEQDGTYAWTASTDAPWAYSSDAVASPSPSGTGVGSTGAGVPIDYGFIVLNIPSWDGSDGIGFYVASYDLPLSQTLLVQAIIGAPANTAVVTVGELAAGRASVFQLTEPLLAEVGNEYLSQQVIVAAPHSGATAASEAYDDVLQYDNLAALEHSDGTWEIVQFTDVVANDDGTRTFSGLMRGRFNTEPKACDTLAHLVMLDDSVQFYNLEPFQDPYNYSYGPIVGQIVEVRALAENGAIDPYDDTTSNFVTPNFTEWLSAKEWTPANVTATRDSSSNVTVSWLPRPRFGREISPSNGEHLIGFRVAYTTDAGTVTQDVDASTASYTFAGVPANATITVTALSSLNCDSDPSEGIIV